MLKRFNQFLFEARENNYLLYYAFDWDDNILNMPTVIHMDHLVNGEWTPTDVPTNEFADVRNDKENWRITNNDPDKAFSEFRDLGPRGENAFLEDTLTAIRKKRFGPAWNDFIECLTSGSLFSIITARGHEPDSIRKSIEWIIDNHLSDEELYTMYNNLLKYAYLFKEEGDFDRLLKGKPTENDLVKLYLDNCQYVGVSAPSRGGSPDNPEKAKEQALLDFKSKINNFASKVGFKAKIGFSDDDLKNAKHIEDLINELDNEEFPHIKEYVVKTTKNPDNITKKTRTVESNNEAPGMQSSVLPFTTFDNLTNRLHPKGPKHRQDDYANQTQRQSEYLAKTSKELLSSKKTKSKFKKKKKKKKK